MRFLISVRRQRGLLKRRGGIFVVIAPVAFLWMTGLGAEEPPPPDWVPRLLSAEEAAEGFFPLFNGVDFDGWYFRSEDGLDPGKPEAFAIQDGILACGGPSGTTWLATVRTYENFVVRYHYRVPPEGGNSGVAIRAPREGDPAFGGMEIQVSTPRKPPDTHSVGAIYDVVAPADAADNPAGQWNAVEILCDGPRIRTTMNGVMLYDIRTSDYVQATDRAEPLAQRPRSGHIALQAHGEDRAEFRNIRLRPLPGGEGWRLLFDGKTLEGWQVIGDATWTVMPEGFLRVNGATMTPGSRSALRTLEEFDNFELRLSVRAHDRANSGVFFRCSGDDPWPRTYEAQVDNHSPEQFTGAIWDQMKARELRAMDNCWFQMRIVANGPFIQVAVNGKTVVDYLSRRHSKFPSGWIALQGHDPKSVTDFKDIEIKPITP